MAWFNSAISHGYSATYQGPGTDTPHYAIDLAAGYHTPFSFPTPGVISQADYAVWSGQPGGGEVFIKPDDGSTPQYVYHLDEIDVQQGQHVSAGQQIGLSGGQNSGGQHPTSSMWSSGPHIHYGFFQKYVNTAAGSRPYGPDITSYYHGLATNGAASPDLLSSYSSGITLQPGTSATGGALSSLFSMPTPDQFMRAGLVIGGAILVVMGLRSLLGAGKVNLQLPEAGDTSALEQGSQKDAQTAQKQQAAAAKAAQKQQAAAAKAAQKQATKAKVVQTAEETAEVAA